MFHVKQWRGSRRIWRCSSKWNPRINLVSTRQPARRLEPGTIADSAQLWALRPPGARLWLDLGSGAGFPGLVIAAMAAEAAPELAVRLVESDQRKAAFLRDGGSGDRAAVDGARRAGSRTLPPQAPTWSRRGRWRR